MFKFVGVGPVSTLQIKKGENMKKILPILINILIIPFTIFIGSYFLDDKKYYFVSLLIILETLLSFFYSFEKRKAKLSEIITLAVLCALAVAGRIAFYMVPEVKPLLAITIISGAIFGKESGFLVGSVAAFVSNIYFGQGPWTPWQMLATGITGFFAGAIFKKSKFKESTIMLSTYGFLSALILYGGIMNFYSLVSYTNNINWESYASTCLLGLSFDLTHAISTFIFLILISKPLISKLERVKVKYGMIE